jgi:hypothetical protein
MSDIEAANFPGIGGMTQDITIPLDAHSKSWWPHGQLRQRWSAIP